MARVYGFRIYVVQAFPNRKKGKEALDVSASSKVSRELPILLERLASHGTHFFAPPPAKPGEPARASASATFKQVQELRPGLVHFTISSGTTGSHGTATRPNKKTRSIKKWSPETDHIATIVFPDQADDRFLLAIQTYKGSEPVRRLISLLTRESRSLRDEAISAEKQHRADLSAAQKPRPKKLDHRRLVFTYKQAADNAYLSELLSGASTATASFVTKVPSARSSNRKVIGRKLTINLEKEEVQSVGQFVGRLWSGRRRRGEATTPRDGLSELGGMLEERDLLGDGEAHEYDEASLSVSDPEHGSTTIAVDTLKEAFTYPVSDGEPSAWYYYDKLLPRLQVIAGEESLNIVEVDANEVDEWLNGSTQAP